MTNKLFDELLDAECRDVAVFYQTEVHYECHRYVRIVGEGPNHTAPSFAENVEPGEVGIPLETLMRKKAAKFAFKHDRLEPLAIFVILPGIGFRLVGDESGLEKVITIYGVTSDGRFNLAVLNAQFDEDGRLYATPTDVIHAHPKSNLQLNVDPYLEFFKLNEELRIKQPA